MATLQEQARAADTAALERLLEQLQSQPPSESRTRKMLAVQNELACRAARKAAAEPAEPQRQFNRLPVASRGNGPLVERYRPSRLAEIAGQPQAVRALRAFLANPYATAFLFHGDTGTGKTSAALALAAELGCAVDQAEYGGVWQIASGEQSADNVRQTAQQMWYRPMFGSGWRVFIVNECDRMNPAAETLWLDRLEQLPDHAVVVFTTNNPEKLSDRFADRCIGVRFESQQDKIRPALEDLIYSVIQAESGSAPDAAAVESIADKATRGSRLSFRRALQLLQVELPAAAPVPMVMSA